MTGLFRNLAFLAFLSLASVSRGEGVYVTEGPNGPTFSNIPQKGSKEVNLRPLTVIQTPKEEKTTPAPLPARGAAASGSNRGVSPGASRETPGESVYREFSVIWPQDNGSVIINPGTFDVRLSVDPALRLEEGHSFSVSINGEPVRERFTAAEFMIPPEFWGESIPANQFARLEASIVDRNGAVLKKAAPIRFMMRFTTVLQNPNLNSRRYLPGSTLPRYPVLGSDRHPPLPERSDGSVSWQGGDSNHHPGDRSPSGVGRHKSIRDSRTDDTPPQKSGGGGRSSPRKAEAKAG
ncbi:MAG: hypothetical protein LBJ76_07190 [Candidatus Accumulibacter sp.]|jgi:hypothetical protein|nr:hypothetical protein [Accumulibacter sp.]